MMIMCAALYMLFIMILGPRLWAVVSAYSGPLDVAVLIAYALTLLLYAAMSAYFIGVTSFGMLSSEPPTPEWKPNEADYPSVALLYTVCNDFQEGAVLTAISQDYPNYHVFLLDDSWLESSQHQVDVFHRCHLQNTTVIRRQVRHGFKAGNLNDCLRGAASGYEYFVVMDADERLPPDFLQRTVPYLETSDFAFVQANHAPSPFQSSAFARDLGPTLLPFWDMHCRPRNRYGLVMYVGHGALIRTSDWEAVGGFSDVALEDFAFTGDLALRGKRGIYLPSLLCFEDFPDGYLKFKRQYERFVAGALEISSRLSKRVLLRSKLTLVERIDFCLWIVPLFVPLLSLCFCLISVFGVGVLLGTWRHPTLIVGATEWPLLPALVVEDSRFAPLWDWQFTTLSLLLSFSPAFACVVLGVKGKLNPIKLLANSFVAYMSAMVVSLRGFVRFCLTGKTLGGFTSGGVRLEAQNQGANKLGGAFVGSMVSTWAPPRFAELAAGLLIMMGALVCFNFSVAAVGFCLLSGMLIERVGWESWMIRWCVTMAFCAMPLQILLNLVLNRHTAGLPPMVFSLHL